MDRYCETNHYHQLPETILTNYWTIITIKNQILKYRFLIIIKLSKKIHITYSPIRIGDKKYSIIRLKMDVLFLLPLITNLVL